MHFVAMHMEFQEEVHLQGSSVLGKFQKLSVSSTKSLVNLRI